MNHASSSSPPLPPAPLLQQIKIQMLTKHNQYEGFFCSSISSLHMIDGTHLFHHFRFPFSSVSRISRAQSFSLPCSCLLILFCHHYRATRRYHRWNPRRHLSDVTIPRSLLLFCLTFISRLSNTNKSIRAFFILLQLLCTFVWVRVVLVIGGSST